MKHTFIFSLTLVILLCAGCGAPTIKGTVEPTASPAPPTQTIVPTPAVTPEPEEELSHYIGYVREPEAYVELSEFLRQFRFGSTWETEPNERYVFEPSPGQLTTPLWRAQAHQKPLERDIFQICEVNPGSYYHNTPLPGMERESGFTIKVRRLMKNPEYTEDNGELYYIASDKVERLACSESIIYYLNGYGITSYSYPTFTEVDSFEDYIQVDLDREIEGKKEKGQPWRIYEIYYADYEAVCLQECQDMDEGFIGGFE